MTTQIQSKRGTAARWASLNVVLASGESGLETDTKRRKTGDGATAWNSLPYDFDQTAADARYPAKSDVIGPSAKGTAGGVATLGSDAKLVPAQVPASLIPKWQPTTVYALNDQVVSPAGDVLLATAHTSGATFDSTKWVRKSLDAGGVVAWQSSQPNVLNISSTWVVLAVQTINAKAGRTYRLAGRVNSLCTAVANLAFAMEVRKSASNDTSNVGTAVDDSGTFYTAPVAGQGALNLAEWYYRPSSDETVNLKLCATRAAGTASFETDQPRLNVFDVGAQV